MHRPTYEEGNGTDAGQRRGSSAEQFDYMAAEEDEQEDEAAAKQYIDALLEKSMPGCFAASLAALASATEVAVSLRVCLIAASSAISISNSRP